ncbi:bifunctional oligoribonuclease/PAP phosphatase NrnA [Globicatella sp. PHS-GS-PNBC-21-1553]|uniref:DHH family phosphoesterase n=1 Tax=Globicatella sp. PHS-GS-PNBC-21-1553 TaxID=2885764 RepID=UPI00298F2C6F|nr:bifunctional oligoribonuclease/PAP phosphatase NrnA [Globicatella sp. PHS-GS-PNBC-21-1553]WPC08713.1 bifunctional oligoribonuclease/PAP phosphatase NrnA [Globicatella sp. PHS-GS-PNBC-21-1553]
MSYLIESEVEAFFQKVKAYDKIIIHRHQRPDPDALGSQLGLKYLIENAFPNKKVLAAGTNSKGLSWLGQMDKVPVEEYPDALVIITDTANTERIDGDHYQKGQDLIKIDHHPIVEEYGSLQIVKTEASSCSEIIVAISELLGERLPLNLQAAKLLYAGIVGDTGRFLYNSTTALTYKYTALLLEQGIDAFAINDYFQVMTPVEVKLQGFGYENLQVNEAGVAVLRINREDLERYGASEEQTNGLVNLASRIQGVYCWVTFVQQEGADFFYRCRIRSKGPVINEIAALHAGGGHPMASGANAYSEEELNEIVEQLSQASLLYQQQIKQ